MRTLTRLLIIVGVASQFLILGGCDWMQKKDTPNEAREGAKARARARQLQQACASSATYDRLKQVAFDEAIRIRNADPVNLDLLATHSVVRMEQPRVARRDDLLDVTVCSGRFILELPPGAERAFAGERRLTADIEYAAQAAADGSGLVYQIKGAEPIIYKLAAFDLKNSTYRPPAAPDDVRLAADKPPEEATAQVETRQPPQAPAVPTQPPPAGPRRVEPAPAVQPPPETIEVRSAARSNPSFNCRHARTRSERMVCGNDRLASLDRAMSSLYYSALSDADRQARADLRRTRDRFLSYRDRCPSERCVADAYHERMAEIRDIVAGP